MILEPVRYGTADGLEISGVFTTPESPCGFAVLAHGIAVDKDEWQGFYRDLAVRLADNDIASLRFDFRGHGSSSGGESSASIIGEILDMRASLSEVRKRWNGAVSLIGTSVGAGPSIFTACEEPDVVDRVVMIAPVLDYRRTFLEPTTDWAKDSFNERSLRDVFERGYLLLDEEFRVSARLVEEFRWLEPYRALKELRARVLLIHGELDSMVPIELSRRYFVKQEHWRFVELEGADHGFAEPDDEEGTSPRSVANKEKMFGEIVNFLTLD